MPGFNVEELKEASKKTVYDGNTETYIIYEANQVILVGGIEYNNTMQPLKLKD